MFLAPVHVDVVIVMVRIFKNFTNPKKLSYDFMFSLYVTYLLVTVRTLLFVLPFSAASWKCLQYSPNGRFLVQETFPKTLPWFVLILISLQRWQHRTRNETKHFVSPHLIGPQLHQHDLASK